MTILADFTPEDLAWIITMPMLLAFWSAVLWLLYRLLVQLKTKSWSRVLATILMVVVLSCGGAAMRVPGLSWAHDLYESEMVYGKLMLLPAPVFTSDSGTSFTGDGTWMQVRVLPDSYWKWLSVHEADLMKMHPLTWSPEWKTTKWQRTPTVGIGAEISQSIAKTYSGAGGAEQIRDMVANLSTNHGSYYAFSEGSKYGYRHYFAFYLLNPASMQAISIFFKI